MKVQLVNAPLSETYYGISRSGVYQPLNLVALATYIKYALPYIDIEILDGDVLPKDEILKKIDADIVGISPKILTYESSLEIAQVSKEIGALVVMGGPHATALSKVILEKRDYVDYIVIGDGEKALVDIIKGKPKPEIDNIAFKETDRVVFNREVNLDLNELPTQDNSFIDLSPYFDNFKTTFGHYGFAKPISVYSHKGCSWQLTNGGCVFCRRFERGARSKEPTFFWDEIKRLIKDYDIDFIWDVSDDFTADKVWLERFVREKPAGISTRFFVYGRPNYLDEQTVKLLSELGCYEILVGVESGDNSVLKKTVKGISIDDGLNAGEILKDFGIKMYPSFVLGLPGETNKTARKTLDLARRLVDTGNVYQLACSTLIPLPQSKSFDMVISQLELKKKYMGEDILPVEELRKDWVKYFCNVEYAYLEEILSEILKLVPVSSSFGRPKE